jgi:hypothetical protein
MQSQIASADVVLADDPDQGFRAVFFGLELLEEIARSG